MIKVQIVHPEPQEPTVTVTMTLIEAHELEAQLGELDTLEGPMNDLFWNLPTKGERL